MASRSGHSEYFREGEFRFQRDLLLLRNILVQTQAVTAVAAVLPEKTHLHIFWLKYLEFLLDTK